MMTPKEKAKELAGKMLQYQPFATEFRDEKTCFEFAKQCALIAVDEILNALSPYGSKYKYWLEVKQEIEKL